MKVRNILIGLLVVLMAFVFISCEDEPAAQPQPKPQPGPAPVDDNTIAKLTVTKDISEGVYKNEKFQMQWDLKKAFGEDTDGIEEGSVLSLQFRSSRDIHWIDFRTNKLGVIDKETGDEAALDMRWIYEEGSLDKLDSLELGEDGWYTLTYTFKDTAMKYPENLDYDKYYYTYLGMNFAGYLMKGDVLEIKNASIDGKVLPLTSDMLYTGYTDNSSLEIVTAHDWTIPKTYAVVYAQDGVWRGEAGVPVEAVAAGGKATGVPATNGFTASYTLGEEAFDLNTAINSDLILSYTLTPVQWTVTFDTKGGSEMEPKQVTHGTKLSLTNEELPTYPTYELLGWFLDSDCTQAFDLATETITGNITLYAGWAQNLRHVTIDLDNAEGTDDVSVKNVVNGGTVTASWFDEPYYPGFYFAGWFVGEDAFDPATYGPVTSDITVKAHWTPPTKLYSIKATAGDGSTSYDKFRLNWDNSTTTVSAGTVLTFQYRSTVDFNKLNVRTSNGVSNKWVYEADISAFANQTDYMHEAGADGWISVKYVFPAKFAKAQGNYFNDGDDVTYPRNFMFDLISTNIRPGDILEIKGIALDNEPFALEKVGVCADIADPSVESVYKDIYGAWPETVAVSFVYPDKTAPVNATFGQPVELPADAATYVDGQTFLGWYTDEGHTVPFNTASKMTSALTLYGYWVPPVTVTLDPNDGNATKNITVGYSQKINQNDIRGFGKAGFTIQWCKDAGGSTPWDFANDTVTVATTLYAKWVSDSTITTFTEIEKEDDRFQFRWKSANVSSLSGLAAGDVFTFQVKFTPTGESSVPATYRVRTIGNSHILSPTEYTALPSPDGEGWYTITVVVPEEVLSATDNQGIQLAFFRAESAKIKVGDVIAVKNFTYNGVALPLTSGNTSEGYYPSSGKISQE